jgi:hypothetical protein
VDASSALSCARSLILELLKQDSASLARVLARFTFNFQKPLKIEFRIPIVHGDGVIGLAVIAGLRSF